MKKTLTREQIDKYNAIVEATIGTKAYNLTALYREYRDDDTKKWGGNPYNYLYSISKGFDDAVYYIKTLGDRTYIYMDLDGAPVDRYRIDDKPLALAFFGV